MFYELESYGILRKIYEIFAENATAVNIRNYQIINILHLELAEFLSKIHGKLAEFHGFIQPTPIAVPC